MFIFSAPGKHKVEFAAQCWSSCFLYVCDELLNSSPKHSVANFTLWSLLLPPGWDLITNIFHRHVIYDRPVAIWQVVVQLPDWPDWVCAIWHRSGEASVWQRLADPVWQDQQSGTVWQADQSCQSGLILFIIIKILFKNIWRMLWNVNSGQLFIFRADVRTAKAYK